MKTIDYNKRAEDLAKELLGKTIINNKHNYKYMITVTEAYPFDETEAISYVNKYKSGKGHDALIGEDKIGTCFIYGGMLHIVCKGGMKKREDGTEEYRCDNILIRGAIKVDNDKLKPECDTLNFVTGKPFVLCSKKLGVPSNQPTINLRDGNSSSGLIIADYKSYADENIKLCKRVNIKNDSKLRFYIDKDCILKEV